jgi:hypothetical protein
LVSKSFTAVRVDRRLDKYSLIAPRDTAGPWLCSAGRFPAQAC